MLIASEVATQPVALILVVLVTSMVSSFVSAVVMQKRTQARFQKDVQEYEAKIQQRDEGLGDHLKVACNIIAGYRRGMSLAEELPMDKALSHLQYTIQVLTGDTPTGVAPPPGQGIPGSD